MPDRKNYYTVLINSIPGNITAAAKFDEPFPEFFGKVINDPAEVRVGTKHIYPLPDSITCSACSIRAFGAQKILEPLKVPDCRGGKLYL